MPIRITGMNSGLDTESIITELVKAQKTKSEKVKKQQTKLEWKQDAWKELNSKIYKLFNSTLSNMRFATDYSKKTTDISNSSIASIVTGDDAMNATQTLQVNRLATTAYMTGAEISGDVTKSSKLSDLGIAEGSTITLTTDGKSTDITVTSGMTVYDFVNKLKLAGVEANFDEKNKRLHIAAKSSGKDSDFTITAANADGTDALNKLGILAYDNNAIAEYQSYVDMTADEKQAAIDADVATRLASYISKRTSLLETQQTQQDAVDASKTAFTDKYSEDIDTAVANKADLQTQIDDLKAAIEAAGDEASEDDKNQLASLQEKMTAVEQYEKEKAALDATNQSLAEVEQYLDLSDPSNITASTMLTDEVTAEWDEKIATAQGIIADYNSGTLTGSEVHKTAAQDAKITLNGVVYEGSSNTFEVNGLTITALQESEEEVTLTTRQDTDGIYDMIKNFFKEYNSLINEMDSLYNAESASDYEPLTDDEKEEMSDSEIEKWETKIKDSILRRDSNLSTISSAMKTIMLQGVTVNGKQMYLADFGIETLGYFSAEENERNAYHINGDEDDSAVSSSENTLKAMIASDPDTVVSFFSQLTQNLYTELNNQSKSVEGIRSFGSFYDDKKMKEDYEDYTEKIQDQEDKLTALEDRWYSKFSAMETALAKMQSNQSAVSSLLGG